MKIYTRAGDDGSTRLYRGGRVPKNHDSPEAYGTVDEAQAAIGVARAESGEGSEIDDLLVGIERDLWVLMGELATEEAARDQLVAGEGLVTDEMVARLEDLIDDVMDRFEAPTEFVVPGQNRLSAALDLARTVVRRAERRAIPVAVDGSQAVPYLNRLSDLLWALARWQEGTSVTSRAGTGPSRQAHD